jgi:rubrerythrin
MKRSRTVDADQLNELLYQALETELGGIQVYKTALECVVNPELKGEWGKYLDETIEHARIVTATIEMLGIDPDAETPGRQVVRHIGESLVAAMKMALRAGPPEAAQLVAAECVVSAETKDHLNWELIGFAVKHLQGDAREALKQAHDQVESQEDSHLYHNAGWARELWLESLDIPAVIPPPEEEKDVKTAIGAARAKKARAEML